MKISNLVSSITFITLLKAVSNIESTLTTNNPKSKLIVPKGIPKYTFTYSEKEDIEKMFIIQFYDYEILKELPSLPSVKIIDTITYRTIFDLETAKWLYDEPLVFFP